MIAPADLEACARDIQTGSRSFYAASRLLPKRVRDPALALYAFCRLADDAVDLQTEKAEAVLRLRDRLDLVYRGSPRNAAADRAFAAVIHDFEMPRALPEALLEGLAWDAVERRYDTLSDLYGYSARVAAAVGVMMCVLMRVRDSHALSRAADLGVAMQLTNIARDVGEDARAGRLYLPLEWMEEAGLEPDRFLAEAKDSPAVRGLVRRLLAAADKLYQRSEAGITRLPLDCRPGILAARYIYAAIGQDSARHDYNAMDRRAHTTGSQKVRLLTRSVAKTVAMSVMPQSAVLYAPPLGEVQFLVDATASDRQSASVWGEGRSGALVAVLAQLEARDRSRYMGYQSESRLGG